MTADDIMGTNTDHPVFRDPNYKAYRRLKPSIDRRYPGGRFVAIVDGRIAADAARFDDLERELEARGLELQQAFVIQAGVDYPEKGVILV